MGLVVGTAKQQGENRQLYVKMNIGGFFANLFKFRKTSLTVLTFLTFLIIIVLQDIAAYISLLPPKNEPVLLSRAWDHLQVISSLKHPLSSHANDYLHDYLKNAIEEMVEAVPFIEMACDREDNHTIYINQHDVFDKTNDDNRIIYYESSNLLVKLQGADASLPGILVSSHFDSVPTSFGTTDDGMGVASMLAALQRFTELGKQPLRTVVFNFNNNEEFGLLGAESFIQHKWFKDVKFFINLEGTGAGGQPILFRGTDKTVIDWYNSVTKPFANSIFQEGFKSGFIGSQTDYHVYEQNGLRGLDIAFYLPRSFYHTIRDSIKYTSKGSLWMMITNVLDILTEVADSSSEYSSDLGYSIYFDILNMWFFNVSLNTLFGLNVILLTLVPIINFILLLIISKRKTWFIGLRGWCRFPFSLFLSYYALGFTTQYLYNLNPLLVSVDYYSPIIMLFCIAILISYIVLNLANRLMPVHDQKLVILLESNVISWISVVWMTFKINRFSNICGYPLTIIYVLSSLATIIGLLTMAFRNSPAYKQKTTATVYGSSNGNSNHDDIVQTQSFDNSDPSDAGESHNSPRIHNISDIPESHNDENQPLLNETTIIFDHETRNSFMHRLKQNAINSLQFDWLLQFIILVPLSAFFIYTEGRLVIDALHETVQENKSYDDAVWNSLILFSGSLAIIMTPFLHKLNFVAVQVVFLLLIYSSVLSHYSVPYDENTPIKLRYVKTFDINTNTSMSNVYGRYGYIADILEEVPYIDESEISCTSFNTSGTETCSYPGNRPWLLSGSMTDNAFNRYLNITVLSNTNTGFDSASLDSLDRFSPLESVLRIDVKDSRICYINFNTTNPKFKAPVKMVTLFNDAHKGYDIGATEELIPNGMSRDKDGNWIFKLMKGIDLLQLHKLEWQSGDSGVNTFTVGIQWLPFMYDNDVELISSLGVNVQCLWSNYDDIVVVDQEQHAKVQDYIDLMMYTEAGVAWTNLRPGIVQGNAYVEI